MSLDWGTLSVYLLGVFLGALDTNVIAPIFPLLERGFHVSLAWTAWTVTAYTVSYAVATVMGGALGDRVGHRRLFEAGLMAFGVASILAALSPNFGVFVAARIIQGAGAGAVYPNAQAAGLRLFPDGRRGTALGLFGAVFGMAAIVGPVVGGALGQYVGWPAVFWLNAPLAVLILLRSRRLAAVGGRPGDLPDATGGVAFSVFIASALLVLAVGGPGRIVFAVLALAALWLFLQRERAAVRPFLDWHPLGRRSGAALMVGAALIGLDMSAVVFVPTLAQRDLTVSVFVSGVALLPAAFSGAVASGAVGVMVDRLGGRRLIVTGLLAAAAGGILLAWPHVDWLRFVVAMVVLGTATALTMGAPLNRLGLALYRDDQTAEALALMAVFRSVGLAAGPVVLTAAARVHGFTGMFSVVALASMAGALLFLLVPEAGGRQAGPEPDYG
ncbi:MAG: MFS transporter [Clostridia bacterium]